jgi:hypothetical protein
MKIQTLFQRSRNLILNPVKEFGVIYREAHDILRVNKKFSIPFAFLIAICSLIGEIIKNISSSSSAFAYIAINAIILFFLILTHIYLSGKSICILGKNISGESRSSDYYALATYSQVPFLLILALTKLLPSLIFFIVIGLYSAMLFYSGTGVMTKIPGAKILQFTILSVLIMIISFIIFSELYTILYSEILAEFSTFAGL